MGKQRTHRWDRRKANLARAKNTNVPQLFTFQIVILVFVFFLWAIGFKFLSIYAITTSICLDAMTYFGSNSDSPTTWLYLRAITQLVITLWIVIAATHWPKLKKLTSAAFHGILLLCLVILHSLFSNMIIPDVTRPDIIINVQKMVKSSSSKDPTTYEYTPVIVPHTNYVTWHQGTPPAEHFEYEITIPRCVWLDSNRISEGFYLEVDGYADMSTEAKLDWFWSSQSTHHVYDFDPLKSSELITHAIKYIFHKPGYNMSDLMEFHPYRELLPDEKARALKKIECFKNNLPFPNPEKSCSFTRIMHVENDSLAYP